ncbi:integrase family protein [Delftia sp. Cs1-4]|uniref:site-specific integrase n=1 Tax=Delftia sp. (strain Cs1-4) TaxID=742013 RepID=UPI00020E7ADE|nr:site-specific integrase [Delftia sp. Cs1-4]AEF88748.1 integrase family protein [Delftia sp. Cs1-4]
MDSDRLSLSKTLLLAVLAGKTYEAAARDHGLTRTAVERRVKSLVLRLIREVGVDGLNESRAMFARKLRVHRPAIEAALQGYVPVAAYEKDADPVVLSDEDIRTALRRVRLHTQTPERDVAMVWILLATGLRPLEIARMQVGDYLNADGTVRLKSLVRPCVAVNARARPLYFSSEAARAAIDAYLATRTQAGGGTPYRGLDPSAALFLEQHGRPFLVEALPTPSGTRFLCQEIHYAYRKIFRRIGFPGLSALSVRYTVMDRLARRGADERQIGELLGIREPRPPKRPRLGLDELMDGLL